MRIASAGIVGVIQMVVRASCRDPMCNMVVHYFPPITLKQIQDCPPFSCIPLEPGEHKHDWKIEEISIGGKPIVKL